MCQQIYSGTFMGNAVIFIVAFRKESQQYVKTTFGTLS